VSKDEKHQLLQTGQQGTEAEDGRCPFCGAEEQPEGLSPIGRTTIFRCGSSLNPKGQGWPCRQIAQLQAREQELRRVLGKCENNIIGLSKRANYPYAARYLFIYALECLLPQIKAALDAVKPLGRPDLG